MFTRPEPDLIASDEGFSVRYLGSGTGLEYSEGLKSALIGCEKLMWKCGIAVFKDSLRGWQPPHEAEPLSEDDRDRIADNIRRAYRFRNKRVEIVDGRLNEEENQRNIEAADRAGQLPVVRNPRVGLLNFAGADSEALIASDARFLKSIFGSVRCVGLTGLSCDVLFLYAKLDADGLIVGSPAPFRDIVRDSGAKIVVFGLPNSPKSYGVADKISFGANYKITTSGLAILLETLDRRGTAFEEYLTGIFSAMKRGVSLCTALGYRSLFPPDSFGDKPSILIQPEIDPFTFG